MTGADEKRPQRPFSHGSLGETSREDLRIDSNG
jgi:hypothetical protein